MPALTLLWLFAHAHPGKNRHHIDKWASQPPDPLEGSTGETCNGVDDDCNGEIDEGFADSDGDGIADCMTDDDDGDGFPDGTDNCPFEANPGQEDNDYDTIGDLCDVDDDGDGDPDGADCAPLDAAIFHLATEVCNLVDDNCDGQIDEAGAADCQDYYADLDSDGFGGAG